MNDIYKEFAGDLKAIRQKYVTKGEKLAIGEKFILKMTIETLDKAIELVEHNGKNHERN